MVVVPALIPKNDPVVALIVPTEGVEELHVPPAVLFVSVVDEPTQVDSEPLIAAGAGLTVTTLVT